LLIFYSSKLQPRVALSADAEVSEGYEASLLRVEVDKGKRLCYVGNGQEEGLSDSCEGVAYPRTYPSVLHTSGLHGSSTQITI
jgi:hypothetical protein